MTWMICGAYGGTAAAGVPVVERGLDEEPYGALTPAQAFGVDVVFKLPETRRYDNVTKN